MSKLIRLVLLTALILLASQSWGVVTTPETSNYQYDANHVVLSTKNYDDDTVSKLWTNEERHSVEPLSGKILDGSFFALVGDFIATKSAGKAFKHDYKYHPRVRQR